MRGYSNNNVSQSNINNTNNNNTKFRLFAVFSILVFFLISLNGVNALGNYSDSYEFDDAVLNASWIPTNYTFQTHTFYPASDIDYVKFNVTKGYYYEIKTHNDTDISITDTVITLLNSNFDAIAYSDDVVSGSNRLSRILYKADSNDTVYLRIEEFSDNANGTYEVGVKQLGRIISTINVVNTSVGFNDSFRVFASAKCVGGPCYDVKVYLDPKKTKENSNGLITNHTLDKIKNHNLKKLSKELQKKVTNSNNVNLKSMSNDKLNVIIKFKDNDNVKSNSKLPLTKKQIKSKIRNQGIKLNVVSNNLKYKLKNKIKIKSKFKTSNVISASIDSDSLLDLVNDDSIEFVRVDKPVKAFLDTSVPLINADDVWNISINNQSVNGSNMTVCVIDTGINYTHSDFGGYNYFPNPKVIAGHDFYNNDDDPMDDNGHGSHVSGIIASMNDTYRGVAPNAKIVSVKVLGSDGSGSDSDVMAGIEYCLNNVSVDVISMSLGSGSYQDGFDCDWELPGYANLFKTAKNLGIDVVVASGNDYMGLTSEQGLSAPACLSDALAIGSSTNFDVISSFTNRNNQVDLFAPGSNIVATNYQGGHTTKSGTSMATPHVAGAILLLKQYYRLNHNINLSNKYVELLLKSTAKTIYDNAGLVNLSYGRIDILNSVESKGIISTNINAKPFYTVSDNPISSFCLSDMGDNVTCNLNWTVFSTGNLSTYEFFTISDNKYDTFYSNKINITIKDLISPQLNYISIVNNSYYNHNNLLLNISAYDNFGIDEIWFNYNETLYNYTIPTNFNFSTNQESNITVYVNDTSGNVVNETVFFYIDTISPVSNISYPLNASLFNQSSILLNFSCNDTNLKYCYYNVFNSNNSLIFNATFNDTNLHSINLNFNESDDYKINLTSYDVVNHSSSQLVQFRLDFVSPLITHISLVHGSYYNNKTLFLNISASDNLNLSNIWYVYNNTNYNYTSAQYFNFSENQYSNLLVYANDTLNNYVNQSIMFYVDTIKPSINVYSQLNNTYSSNSNQLLNLTCNDSFLTYCNYEILDSNNTLIYNGTLNDTLNHVLDFNFNDSGNYKINLSAYDLANNTKNKVINFKLDLDNPIVLINKPLSLTFNNTNVSFNLSISDTTSNISSCWYLLDLNNTKNMLNNCSFINLNLSGGLHNLFVYSNDSLNNIGYDSLSLNIAINNDSSYLIDYNDSSYNLSDANISSLVIPINTSLNSIIVSNVLSSNDSFDIDLSLLVKSNANNSKIATVTHNLTIIRELNNTNASLFIQSNTNITANSNWTGLFDSLTQKQNSLYSISSGTINSVLNLGQDYIINLSLPSRITIPGMAGKHAGWSVNNSVMTPISVVCNDLFNPTNIALGGPLECYTSDSNDLIIWTYHFTTYSAYTPDASSSSSSSSGSSSGSSSSSSSSGSSGGGGVSMSEFFINDISLRNGYTKSLSKGQLLRFKYSKDYHTITVNLVNSDSVNLTIKSTPQNIVLSVGQNATVDLDNDNLTDIYIKLLSIKNGVSKIITKKLTDAQKSVVVFEVNDDNNNKSDGNSSNIDMLDTSDSSNNNINNSVTLESNSSKTTKLKNVTNSSNVNKEAFKLSSILNMDDKNKFILLVFISFIFYLITFKKHRNNSRKAKHKKISRSKKRTKK